MAPDQPPRDDKVSDIYEALAASMPRQEARMPEPISTGEAVQIRNDFNRYMSEHGISVARVAQRLETSKTTASQVLSGKYKADDSKYLHRMREWLADPESYKTLRAPVPLTTAEISCLMDIKNVVDHAYADGSCAVIVGQSGTCKTAFAKARAADRTNCVHVELTGRRYTDLAMLQAISEAVGLDFEENRYTNGQRLCAALCKRLSNPPRVIFIDNAHVLDTGNLWQLHAIHDVTSSTIVVMGQPKLMDTLEKSRSDKGVGATLWSRFLFKLNLHDAIASRINPNDPGRYYRPSRQYLHTTEDIVKLLKTLAIKVHQGAVDRLVQIANCPDYGGTHMVTAIARNAWRIYEGTGISELTLDHVLQMERILLPDLVHRALVKAVDIQTERGRSSMATAAG